MASPFATVENHPYECGRSADHMGVGSGVYPFDLEPTSESGGSADTDRYERTTPKARRAPDTHTNGPLLGGGHSGWRSQ